MDAKDYCKHLLEKFQYPSSRVILPDLVDFATAYAVQDVFQYPSSRVILPDGESQRCDEKLPDKFQYPSSRVILPDGIEGKGWILSPEATRFNTPVVG